MTTLATFMEIKVIGTIELINAIQDVLARMRVYDVKEDSDTQSVSRVNEFLQVFRRTITRASGKEACHLITKS